MADTTLRKSSHANGRIRTIYVGKLGHYVGYGYTWRPDNDGGMFSRNFSFTDVDVYIRVGRPIDEWGRMAQETVFQQKVGTAIKSGAASKLGRAGIREVITPRLKEIVDALVREVEALPDAT